MRILVFCLQDWSMNFVFVSALKAAGFEVCLLTKKDYLASRNDDVTALYEINSSDDFILFELFEAIKNSSATVIFPSDEIALYYMHQAVLAKESGNLREEFEPLLQIIKRSLPNREYIFAVNNKSAFLKEVESLGFSAPKNRPSKTIREAKDFANEIGYPVLLKLDKSFGGSGVRVCKNEAQMEENFAEFLKFEENGIAVQQILDGVEAKLEMVCVDGKLVDFYINKKLSKIPFGPSDSNIVIENQRACEFAKKIVEKFGYNGFCDCDMIIIGEEPYFLEMNPRKVPHHCFKFFGMDMTKSMYLGLLGKEVEKKGIYGEEFSIFPLNLVNYPQNDDILFTAKNTIDIKNPHLMAMLMERESAKLLNIGNFDKAILFFDKMIDLYPTFWSLHLAKAILVLNGKNYDKAKEAVQKAISLSGSEPLALIYQISILDALGEIDALILAIKDFMAKEDIKPWMTQMCTEILEKNLIFDRFDFALKKFEQENEFIAQYLIFKGDFEGAHKVLLNILSRQKQNQKAWNTLLEIKQNINPAFLNRLHLQSAIVDDALKVLKFDKTIMLDSIGVEIDPIEAVILRSVGLDKSYEEVFLNSMNECNRLGFCEIFKIGAKEKRVFYTPQSFKALFYAKIQKLANKGMLVLFA